MPSGYIRDKHIPLKVGNFSLAEQHVSPGISATYHSAGCRSQEHHSVANYLLVFYIC